MKIKIPESMYAEIVHMTQQKYMHHRLEYLDTSKITLRGPYGDYEIVSAPDEEFTEEVQKTVRVYKD